MICDKQPESSGQPRLLVTFTLPDGSTRSKVCDLAEAIRQLAHAKLWPRVWNDFKIEPTQEETSS